MWLFEINVMLGMIALNGLFAGYEIALASVSLARLRVLEQERRAGAKAALYMKERMEASLAVVQVGITLFGAIAAATGGAGAEENLAPLLMRETGLSAGWAEFLAVALVVLPLTVLTILFGELAPKVFALRNPEWMCLKLSPPMRAFSLFVRPVVAFFDGTVTGLMEWLHRRWRPRVEGQSAAEPSALYELRALAQLARASNIIGRREEAIIRNAAQLSRRPVRDIMLPAAHINMLNAADSPGDALISAHLYLHTRFPVTERPGDPQGIIGFVNFKDIVALLRLAPGQASLTAILHPMPALPQDTPVSASLEMMMRDHTHIAVVRDAAGAVTGLVTLEDVLEALVGQMYDEHDRLPGYVTPAGPGWVVGCGISARQLKEKTGVDLARYGSVAYDMALWDWIARKLGRPALGGDTLEEDGLRVVVRKIRHGRAAEAQLTATPVEPVAPR
jgi:putative hemolysin